MFDVAIVGAGPAGSRAAFHLAEGGARVALLDDTHPREKPCGGGLTARALTLVGSSVADLSGGVPIASARFAHLDREATMQLAAGDGRLRLAVASRRSFDSRLVDIAQNAGALLYPSRVIDINREDDRWRIVTRGEPVSARFLIGADGPGSLVRRRVSKPFDRRDLSIAAGYYVHGLSSKEIDIAFVDNPSGYLWSFPRPDHLAVGVCAQADVSTSPQLLELCSRWIDQNVTGGRRERYGWPIPSLTEGALRTERPSGDGWMLIGDAAGLVDPITREGIFFALLSGQIAAESLLRAADPSAAYARRLGESIYPELIAAARLKARFYRSRFIALLISSLRRSGRIRTVMADLVAGEQSYLALRGRLLRTFEWRLMSELFAAR